MRGFYQFEIEQVEEGQPDFLREITPRRPEKHPPMAANLSISARRYLASFGLDNPNADEKTAGILWMHALAIGHSGVYLAQNADALRLDWPRVPLPKSREALLASADLGRQIAALLDTETPVAGVTAGKVRSELRVIAVPSTNLTTAEFDFRVTAGWGHAGKGGVTMPGKGKLLTRGYHPEEEAAFGVGKASRLSPSQSGKLETGATPVLPLLGHATHDIYLNDTAYWRNVPERVWDFTIGGYQVLKKWLSYREHALLGRPLTTEEAREVTHTARRLAALILLRPELDANYQRVKAECFAWRP